MAKPIPDGFHTVTAHLCIDGAAKAIDFYKKAFGAEEICRMDSPDGSGKLMHAEIKIGNSIVMIADDFPEWCGGKPRHPKALGATPVTLHVYTENCDKAIEKATNAGATVTMPAQDMFWGDRYGQVQDPFGHLWSFATHIADLTPEQMMEGAAKMFAQG